MTVNKLTDDQRNEAASRHFDNGNYMEVFHGPFSGRSADRNTKRTHGKSFSMFDERVRFTAAKVLRGAR